MAKIYTRTGDLGQTKLVGGSSVSKSDLRLEAYGSVDETNSVLGVCHAGIKAHAQVQAQFTQLWVEFEHEVLSLQNQLFYIGSRLACEDDSLRDQLPALPADAIQKIENRIDQWTAILPPLKEFILPGGHIVAAELHVARTVCRRTERAVARLMDQLGNKVHELELQYLNRLSDYLFTAARFANLCLGHKDQTWKKDSP